MSALPETETETVPVSERPPTKTYRDRDWLYEQYVERGRPSPDIAEECGVRTCTITRWLRQHDIPTRTPGESRRLSGRDCRR